MATKNENLNKALSIIFGAGALFIIMYVLTYIGVTTGATAESIVLIFIGGVILIEAFGLLIEKYLAMGVSKSEAETLRNLFRIIAYISLIIFVLYELNINVTGLLVSAGFLGIVLGLAAQATLSNFIAGVYLLGSKAFIAGDRVTLHTWQYTLQPQSYPHDKFIPGFSGVIKNIGLLYTEILGDDNIPVYVPNNIVAQAMIVNYRRATEQMISFQFDLNVNVPYKEVRKIIAAELIAKKIKHHKIDISYMHDDIYVVTVHLESEFKGRADLKSAVYEKLVQYVDKTLEKSKRLTRPRREA